MYQEDMVDEDAGSDEMDPVTRAKILEREKKIMRQELDDEMAPPPPQPKSPPKGVSSPSGRTGTPKERLPENMRIIPVNKVFPWRNNGRRTISTGGAPAYYGVYLHELQVLPSAIWCKLMALGEWNLPSPSTTLFCIREGNYDDPESGETWKYLAEQERQLQRQTQNSHYQSRFDCPKWKPDREERGYYEGYLVFPRSLFATPANGGRTQIVSMSYAATTPWNTDYTVVDLFQMTPHSNGGEVVPIPHQKLPVPPTDPWKPIFPRHVEDRFRARENLRDSNA